MDDNNKYLREKQNRIKQYSRIRLGLTQCINKPILNILWIPIIASLIILWKIKEAIIASTEVPEVLFPIFKYSVFIMEIIVPIICILYLFDNIGELTSRHDEACLVLAFSAKELRNGHPILLKKKKLKGTNVLRREFYSNISLKTWVERKDNIADAMNCHYVEPIQYANGNGKHIVMYTASGRNQTKREKLYDE